MRAASSNMRYFTNEFSVKIVSILKPALFGGWQNSTWQNGKLAKWHFTKIWNSSLFAKTINESFLDIAISDLTYCDNRSIDNWQNDNWTKVNVHGIVSRHLNFLRNLWMGPVMYRLSLAIIDQWKRINCKQSTRWQHLSRLKASAFFFEIFFVGC